MNDKCKEFITLKNDLLDRVRLCYVDERTNKIMMYDKTLEAVINFINFFSVDKNKLN